MRDRNHQQMPRTDRRDVRQHRRIINTTNDAMRLGRSQQRTELTPHVARARHPRQGNCGPAAASAAAAELPLPPRCDEVYEVSLRKPFAIESPY
jgi:hypothetical protein